MQDDARSGGFTVINIILTSLGIFSLIASFYPHLFWGLGYTSFFPLWLRLFLVGGLALFCIPPLSRAVAADLSRLESSISEVQKTTVYILIFAGLIALFIIFSSRNHILGDGYVIQGTIQRGLAYSATEPLEYFLHSLIVRIIGSGQGAYLSYAITSYISGAAFLIIIYLFLKDQTGPIFALVIAFTFANMQFFFGYVENYTTSVVLITLYLFFAWRDLLKKKISFSTVLILALAICFHINNSIYLVTLGYLYLVIMRSRKSILLWAGVLLGALILGIIYLKTFTRLDVLDIFVPLLPTSENPYHLFSRAHIMDLINIWLLNFPLVIIIPMILKESDHKSRWFFISAAAPALLYTIIIDPKLGAPRDWDMLSLPAVSIMAILMITFGRDGSRWKQARLGLVIPLLIFSFLHTGSWIAQNNGKAVGYAWLRPLIERDQHYSSNYFGGYRNKSWSAIVEREYRDAKEAVRANEIRFAGAPQDTFNICQMAVHYLAVGDTARSLSVVRTFWPKFSNNLDVTSIFGAVMYRTKNFDEAQQIYGSYISKGGIDPTIFHDMGLMMETEGKIDSAYAYYGKAFYYWPDAPPGGALSFYLKCLLKGYTDIARDGLNKVLPRLPEYIAPSIIQILNSVKVGDKNRTDSLVTLLNNRLNEAQRASPVR
jgi:hypothetical protein